MNIKEQKQRLILEKEAIEKDLDAMGRTINKNGDWVALPEMGDGGRADDLDNANLVEEFEEKLAVFDILESRHEQIERALRAIENDTYGICEEEGCDIDIKRLIANPSSTTCIKHAK